MKINLFVRLIKNCCWLFLKIVEPDNLWNYLYDINSAFCIPDDKMYGLQNEK